MATRLQTGDTELHTVRSVTQQTDCTKAFFNSRMSHCFKSARARARTHTHAHAHTRTHARTHTRTNTHTRTHAHARTHARTRTHTHAHARTRTHTCRFMYDAKKSALFAAPPFMIFVIICYISVEISLPNLIRIGRKLYQTRAQFNLCL